LPEISHTDCERCGKCCLADFVAYVHDEDIDRWQRDGRDDILQMIRREHALWMGAHLVCADDGRYLRGCLFLSFEGNFYRCSIYEARPRVCRDYQPGSSEICPKFHRPHERPGKENRS